MGENAIADRGMKPVGDAGSYQCVLGGCASMACSHHGVLHWAEPMTGLTREEAAELAGVSSHTPNGWVASDSLRSSLPDRPLRFTAADVLTAKHVAHAGEVVPRWRDDPVHAG